MTMRRRLNYLMFLVFLLGSVVLVSAVAQVDAQEITPLPAAVYETTAGYDNVLILDTRMPITRFAMQREGVVLLENGWFMPQTYDNAYLRVSGSCELKRPNALTNLKAFVAGRKVFDGLAYAFSFHVTIPVQEFQIEMIQNSTVVNAQRVRCQVTVESLP